MAIADPVPVIQATLAPMFLLGGVAFFLWWIQERLFRVTDRVRRLRKVMRSLPEGTDALQEMSVVQDGLLARVILLRNAITFGVVTLVTTSTTAVLIIAPAIVGRAVPPMATVGVFGAGLACFVVSVIMGLKDTVTGVSELADTISEDPLAEA